MQTFTNVPTFRKYSSIENHYRKEYIDKLRLSGLSEGEWVVQEKAHGANLSFLSLDGQHWLTAKRNSTLAPDEAFYNHQMLLEAHRPALENIWQILRKRYPTSDGQVTVYGEVLGGSYPGMKTKAPYKRIQKGVFYSPANHFYAFDIRVGGIGFLGVDEVNELFEKGGFAFAKTRFRGTFTEALAQANDFDSEIPLQFRLELTHPNVAEGTVIRPVEPKYDNAGNRVIIKSKNEQWADNVRHHKRDLTPEPAVSAAALELTVVALEYATPARVAAAVSKVGEVTMKDFGRLVGMVGKDIHADFMSAHLAAFELLEAIDRKAVTKVIGGEATKLVKAYFIDLAT